jgi:hypothetical protein
MGDYRAALARDHTMAPARKALDHLVALDREQKREAAEQKREAARQQKMARQPVREAAPHPQPGPQAEAAIPAAPKPATKERKDEITAVPLPGAKPAQPGAVAARPAPVIEAAREAPAEADAPATGSIAHNHPVAHERAISRERGVAIHGRPERRPQAPTAKSRERERRLAAREREQRRLREEFERAERVVERRPVKRQPQVRYYRAGSRDPSFSDIFR